MEPRPRLSLLALTLFTFLTPYFVRASLTNITIDDSNLAYFTWADDLSAQIPKPPWAAVSPATPCDYCSAQPQTEKIHDQTWHDGTNNSAGSFTFQGSAIYMYGIDLTNPANISFTMDDTPAFHYYDGSAQFVFNALFFSAQNLPLGVNHTLSWVLHATSTNGTVALFDYAVVTVDESSAAPSGASQSPTSSSTPATGSSSSSKSVTGPIVGGVVGGIALIAVISVAVFLLARRRRRPSNVPEGEPRVRGGRAGPNDVEPFVREAPETVTTPMSANGGEKTLDVAWTNPAPAPTTASLPYAATATNAPPTTTLSSAPAVRSTTDVSSVPASSDVSRTPTSSVPAAGMGSRTDADARSRTRTESDVRSRAQSNALEDRIALLEAQVNQHLPPPYVLPPPRE
ncbi:hypothetical protein C8R43DRAFT_967099 [Mycena crocata]|nr:hypothetical protein C8R43DRAFT_967099 [Mycena crocata]